MKHTDSFFDVLVETKSGKLRKTSMCADRFGLRHFDWEATMIFRGTTSKKLFRLDESKALVEINLPTP